MKAASRFAMRHERKSIWLFCAIAALRVFIFSAAFPFFNNVDEQAHFDLVVKYSHFHFPRAFEPVSAESARYIALFGSLEYLSAGENGQTASPPLWKMPDAAIQGVLPAKIAA